MQKELLAGQESNLSVPHRGAHMPFPDTQRVLYEKNPLEEVICQVRFPTILKIDTEVPAGYQELIRSEYPKYEAKPTIRTPDNVPTKLAELLMADISVGGKKAHEFVSRDNRWKLSLTNSFIALTCDNYKRWEEFRKRMTIGLEALQQQYSPTYYTRIGLRYKDVIRRSTVGLPDAPWRDLLNSALAGLLGVPDVAGDVDGIQTTTIMKLPSGAGKVQFKCSLALDTEVNEQLFLIDADFFTDEQVEPDNVHDRLNTFNGESRRFFRWCISDRLHEAMGPQPVPPF